MSKIAFSEITLDEIVDKYRDLVYKLAFARTRNKNDADDIFQEVFLRYVRKQPDFKSEEHAKAWFIRVTINCCKSFWEKLNRRNLEEEIDENITCEEESEEFMDEFLAQLPPDYRVVIHLFYYEDISTSDISKILHKKESTVRMQLTRARRLLKDFMKGGEVDVRWVI